MGTTASKDPEESKGFAAHLRAQSRSHKELVEPPPGSSAALVPAKSADSGPRSTATSQAISEAKAVPVHNVLKAEFEKPQTSVMPIDVPACREDVDASPKQDLHASWEDLETDMDEEHTSLDEEQPLGKLDAKSHKSCVATRMIKPQTTSKVTGHSRARRDLVNLNKAAIGWLRQHAAGELALDEVLERVRTSKAAGHLAAVHGQSYDQSRFVESVLETARKKLCEVIRA